MVDKCDDDIVNEKKYKYKYDEMNVLIKHLENNWTIKKIYIIMVKM